MSSVEDGVALSDQISLGVLMRWVRRVDVEDSVAEFGKGEKRRGGTLPARVMMYFVVALAIFSDEDYEGVFRRLTVTLRLMRGWDPRWQPPTRGGITSARAKLGFEAVRALFERTAKPVASLMNRGAFCGSLRMVSFDGMVFDLPDTERNAAEFGKPPKGVFPQARVVNLVECGSRASLGAHIGGVAGKGTGERCAAADLLHLVGKGMLLICDAGFYSYRLWCRAADTGADLLWRIGDTMALPIVATRFDGSYISIVYAPGTGKKVRAELLGRARAGDNLIEQDARARLVRVIEYKVADRGSGDLICLITTLANPRSHPAVMLADAFHDRWQHETSNKQVKYQLRGPGKILRSQSPDMVRQEIYGYLIAHYAVCALICEAAAETGITDTDRIGFADTIRIVSERISDPDAFSP